MRLRVLVCVLGAALVACRSKPAPSPAASAVLAEAPAPASLVAELSLGNPKETWQRLRALGGGMAQALPSSLPVLLATSLSLPPAVAGSLDEGVPMVGALLSRPSAEEADVVLGMHVLSGSELVASLTLGDGAKFRRVELGPRVVRLVSAPGAAEFNGALGVSGNYLLLATGVDALRDAGRFVAESVSKRARTQPGLALRAGESVLTGSLSRRLRVAWQARRAALSERDRAQRNAKGRAPDFADPEVLLAGADNTIESWLSVLESSRELSLEVSPDADRLRVGLRLTPNPEGAAALLSREMVVGSSAPLLQLPASTRAALLLQGDTQPGAAGAASLGASMAKLFGERLQPAQAAHLSKALDEFARSRRGASVFGFVPGPVPTWIMRCELSDGSTFSDSFAGVLSLLELPPISSWLAELMGKPSLELLKPAGTERHAKLRFARRGPSPATLPRSLSLSWQARDGVGTVLVSLDDSLDLTALAGQPRLGSGAWLGQGHPPLEKDTALSVFADARLLGQSGQEEAPLLLSFGKEADKVAVALEVSPAALPAIARLFALEKSP